jgi:hypothetical protein
MDSIPHVSLTKRLVVCNYEEEHAQIYDPMTTQYIEAIGVSRHVIGLFQSGDIIDNGFLYILQNVQKKRSLDTALFQVYII